MIATRHFRWTEVGGLTAGSEVQRLTKLLARPSVAEWEKAFIAVFMMFAFKVRIKTVAVAATANYNPQWLPSPLSSQVDASCSLKSCLVICKGSELKRKKNERDGKNTVGSWKNARFKSWNPLSNLPNLSAASFNKSRAVLFLFFNVAPTSFNQPVLSSKSFCFFILRIEANDRWV